MSSSKIRERPYQDKFLEVGFYFVMEKGIQKPQCVLCYEVLSSESMKLNKLERHFKSKHATYKDRDHAFFERKLAVLKGTRLDKEGDIQQVTCADPGGGAKGALAPPPSPQNIAPPNSEARAKRALAPPRGAKRALAPPLQNPGSAYGLMNEQWKLRTVSLC